jgi:hypothetical protein
MGRTTQQRPADDGVSVSVSVTVPFGGVNLGATERLRSGGGVLLTILALGDHRQ